MTESFSLRSGSLSATRLAACGCSSGCAAGPNAARPVSVAKECFVQAIHPEGHFNVNECIYCMRCQELYFDDHRCPHMIQVRLKREKRDALSSPSMHSGGKGPNTIITAGGKPIGLPPVDAITPPAT